MGKIQTLIVDDEPLAREGIRLLLKNDKDVEVIDECVNGKTALKVLRKYSPDIVFLDIQMPEMTGFKMLSKLEDEQLPIIIFVTAYDEFAIEAFNAQAIDYLLKPFSNTRFYQALNRAKLYLANQNVKTNNERLRKLLAHHQNSSTQSSEKIIVKTGGRTIFVAPEEIDWVEATDYYITIHIGKRKYLLRETMNQMEARLDQTQFVRIHRSTIINVNKVREFRPHHFGNYVVTLQSDVKLSVSRRRLKTLQTILNSILPQ